MNKTICLQCNNEMIIKLSNLSQNKIILYCEKCFFYNEYLINNDLLDKSLGQNNNLSKNIICKKCNKSYCSKCYLLHKDIITNVKLKPIIIKAKGKPRQKKYIPVTTYSNETVNCDKCKNIQTNQKKGIYTFTKEKIKSIEEINNKLSLAKQHFDIYYSQKKTELIYILQKQIQKIEDYYMKSLSYHSTIFKLIEILIDNYSHSNSAKTFHSINN